MRIRNLFIDAEHKLFDKTIENCSLIKKCVNNGIGEPEIFGDINRCEVQIGSTTC